MSDILNAIKNDHRAMTVAELMDQLATLPLDAIVGFESDYGDYTHTRQFLMIGTVRALDPNTEEIAPTSCSDSGFRIRDIREGESPDDVVRGVSFVVLTQ